MVQGRAAILQQQVGQGRAGWACWALFYLLMVQGPCYAFALPPAASQLSIAGRLGGSGLPVAAGLLQASLLGSPGWRLLAQRPPARPSLPKLQVEERALRYINQVVLPEVTPQRPALVFTHG